jgi:phosphonate transport system permease protein
MLGRIATTLGERHFPPNARPARPDYLHHSRDDGDVHLATVLGIGLAYRRLAGVVQSTPAAAWLGSRALHCVVCKCRMIWTILLVAILAGMPGTLALTAVLHRLRGQFFTEAIEAIRPGPVEAIRATGGNRLQVFIFAVLPQVRVAWTGISIYTWDVVFRAATVVGFFGAGGMGWYLRESVQRIASHDVAAILLSIIIVVVAAEVFSAWLRRRIASAIA